MRYAAKNKNPINKLEADGMVDEILDSARNMDPTKDTLPTFKYQNLTNDFLISSTYPTRVLSVYSINLSTSINSKDMSIVPQFLISIIPAFFTCVPMFPTVVVYKPFSYFCRKYWIHAITCKF